jgi:hypothetical protein
MARRRQKRFEKPKVFTEEEHAIMALDPGGTTGVAAAYVTTYPTLKEALPKARMKKATEVTGNWLSQARELNEMMHRFQYTANVERAIPLSHIHFAIEDFVLRMPAAMTNLTSVWVAAATVGMFNPHGELIHWQQPSSAKHFATDKRLKMWGLYTVGESAHERDAWRHVATLASLVLDKG